MSLTAAALFAASQRVELFDRRAEITVNTLKLKGFRVAFSVKRDLKATPNTADFTIYNLSESHRAEIEGAKSATVRLEAGYVTSLSRLFNGDLRTAVSYREGTDWLTKLSSGDGEKAIQKARVAITSGPKTPIDTTLRAIVKALGVGQGNVQKVAAQLRMRGVGQIYANGVNISGSAANELTDFCRSAGLEWSIQDGAVQILDIGKALETLAVELSPTKGLIGTPTVDKDGVVSASCLMIPDLYPGRKVVFSSSRVKGSYRVEQTTHKGDTHSDEWGVDIQARRY